MIFHDNFWSEVEEAIDLGYIKVQKHPTEKLWIYNYSQECMFSGAWSTATMYCRGLIVDENKNVIARPFPKFFTKEQCDSFQIKINYDQDFEVFDKVDGSLGILYWLDNEGESVPHIATRGSFTSDQSIEATKIFHEKYMNVFLRSDWTYLFEIIYPNNRIVVDYGDKRDLILLAIIETSTGNEIPLDRASSSLNLVTRYHGIKDFSKVLDNFQKFSGTDFEGLVIKFESGFRVKVKTEDYKRLHKILTGINSKRIWECLSNGQGLKEILDVVDDAYFKWVKQVEVDLNMSYGATEGVAKLIFESAIKYADENTECPQDINSNGFKKDLKLHRKYFAEYVLKIDLKVYQSICFSMYAGMDYSGVIWKSLEPRGDQKFKVIEEEG